ncbi:Chromodomain Y-like protein [Schistosoma japonicum]|uniref:Chromodomain Y-like protein n=1 Tax=Schistosoma japonicum TaxID=6182 RepID=A0A4Z2DLR9_SCHJA|nr:Chromodomain Y-like protein [Schistosoma japonicum]
MPMRLEKDSDDDFAADKSSISSTKSQPPPRPFKANRRNAVRSTSRRSAPSSVALSSTGSFSSHPATYSDQSSSLPSSETSVSHTSLVCDPSTLLTTQTLSRSDEVINLDDSWVPCGVSGVSNTSLSSSSAVQAGNHYEGFMDKVSLVRLPEGSTLSCMSKKTDKKHMLVPIQSPNTTKSIKRKSPSTNDILNQNEFRDPIQFSSQTADNKDNFPKNSTLEHGRRLGHLLSTLPRGFNFPLCFPTKHPCQKTKKPISNVVSKPVSRKRVQNTNITSKGDSNDDSSESQPTLMNECFIHSENATYDGQWGQGDWVIAMGGQKHHSIPKNLVLSSLDILVTRGHLHRVESAKGISYRSNPFVVARGDLKKPASLSAKIKAKYNGGVNGKRSRCGKSVVAEPKRSNFIESSNHSSSKIARNLSTTNVRQRPSRRSVMNGSTISEKPAANCSCYSDINGKIFFNQSSVIMDDVRVNQEQNVHLDGGDYSMCVRSPPNNLQQGTKIFVVPPASPLNETTFESQMNNLPYHRSEQATQSSCNIHNFTSGLNVHNSNVSHATNSRRSNRQMDVYRFKSIWVKKNLQGGFTEVCLQSPASSIKNAFTIQVLEELTVVLNRATCDASRLIVISGAGTVFSSGIDLTVITGDLSRSAFIGPSSCDSSHSSSSSSGNACSSRSLNQQRKTATDNSKSHHPDQSNCLSSHCNCESNLHSSSQKNANRVHSFFCPPNPSNVGRLVSALRSFLLALVSFPKPVVVGVNGPALGLAVAILPLCDLIYISDSATFYMPYTRLGQIPEGASTYTLTSLVGMPLANELLLAGRKLSAREALQRGLASDLIFPKSFKQELLLRCRKLAENSCMSLEITKCMMKMQHRERIEYVINTECKKLLECWQTTEFRCTAMEFILNEMDDFV